MDDLVTWLRAQLDEDERLAVRCASVGNYRWSEPSEDDPDGHVVDGRGGIIIWDEGANLSAHIARHDPARVLREVAAKRAIVDRITDQLDRSDNPWWYADTVTPILRHLAAVYSDRDGYRQEWAPDPSG